MGWIILGIIALIIGLFLWFPVRLGVAYGEEGTSCWLKILFWKISIFSSEDLEKEEEQQAFKQKRQKSRKKAKTKKKDSQTGETPKKKQKKSVQEWIELILIIAQSGGKLVKRFWKGFRINDLCLQMAVAGNDAAETAITYGKVNAAVYSMYALVSRIVTLRRTYIQIIPDFLSEESRVEVSGELFFRIGALLAAAFSGGFFFLKKYLAKMKTKKEKEQDAAGQTVS